jgi:16S rRNA (guanine966-N2)-methyltransferase
VRQAIFTILGQDLSKQRCLDLYAGSGVLGIEALSRGAVSCDFVDESWHACQTIEKNLENAGFKNIYDLENDIVDIRWNTHNQDCVKFIANQPHKYKYDLIFADPFYEDVKHKFLLKSLSSVLKKRGHVVFLHSQKFDIAAELPSDSPLKIQTQRKFGQTLVTILSL